MIKVQGLNKFYNKGKKSEHHVLNNINLELDQTGLVCILGESGSGKTTLLNTIGGLDTFSDGTITIDDTRLEKYDPRQIEPIRNDRFGYIFQNYYLLQDYTVAYNVKLALNRYDLSEEEKDARVEYVLDMLGIGKYKKKLVSKLSGGQQQRVSIARALVKSPDIILADEPTGNLDEENTLRTMSILKSISRECLVILVSHEKRIARFFADRIVEIQDGRIVRDTANRAAESYQRSDDSNIYLREMECENLENDLAEFKLYYKSDSKPEKIRLKLAWKDGKLYIQNDMNCDVIFEGEESGCLMLDEERPELDISDVENFSYQLSKLPSKGSAQLSGREVVRMALENIRLMGKKQAFVIAILLVTAVLLTITVADYMNTISVNENEVVADDSHYVHLDFEETASVNDSDMKEQIRDYYEKYVAEEVYGSVFVDSNTNLSVVYQGFTQLSKLTAALKDYSYVSLDHLDESDLICGRMPEKRNEVVLDKWLIDQFTESKSVLSSMYKDVEAFLGNRLLASTTGTEFVVTGISDTREPAVYCSQNILLGMSISGYKIASVPELKAEYPEEYENLSLKEQEILVPETVYRRYQNMGKKTADLDDGVTYQIVGYCPDSMGVDYIMSNKGCESIRNLMIFNSESCRVYTEETGKAVKYFEKSGTGYERYFKVNATVPYEEQIRQYNEERKVNMDGKKLVTLAIMSVSLIMIYFTIKSNAVSRSEELTVYRLIGIARSSILKAYMLEMCLITSYTALPAVLITSGVIRFVGSIPSLELGMLFPWWSVVILLTGIFAVNVFISILPVYSILSKPPATLAVKE